MSLSKNGWMFVLVVILACGSLPAYAAFGIRQSSDNGQSGAVNSWSVLGRTVAIPLGKKVMLMRQVICATSGDRQDGSCVSSVDGSGNYVFLFQFQATPGTALTVNIGQLQKNSATSGGATYCNDDPMFGNNQELCSQDPSDTDPNHTIFLGMTFTVLGKTSARFMIPSFPTFLPGMTPEEGQGLTLYIQTHQSAPLPIAYPSVGVQ